MRLWRSRIDEAGVRLATVTGGAKLTGGELQLVASLLGGAVELPDVGPNVITLKTDLNGGEISIRHLDETMFRANASHLNRLTSLHMSSGGARPEQGFPTPASVVWNVADMSSLLHFDGPAPYIRLTDARKKTASLEVR